MKKYLLIFSFFAILSYADDSAQAQALKGQLEQLVTLDRQIEELEKQKLEYKAEIAQHLERGSVGILPGEGRRQARRTEDAMQDVQNINSQLQQLEQQRQSVIMALK
jgi:flagellar biosynthesis chaperone FliJ